MERMASLRIEERSESHKTVRRGAESERETVSNSVQGNGKKEQLPGLKSSIPIRYLFFSLKKNFFDLPVNHNIRPFGVNALNGEFLLRFDYYFSSFFFFEDGMEEK
jgi:hypothetical protein